MMKCSIRGGTSLGLVAVEALLPLSQTYHYWKGTRTMNTPQPTKVPFINVFQQSRMSYPALLKMGEEAHIPRTIIETMVVGKPVPVREAASVLAILSRVSGETYTLDNVAVSTFIPTLNDLGGFYRFNPILLSQEAGVPSDLVEQMLCDEPIPKGKALRVLQALSKLLGREFTLDNVAVKLIERGGEK